MLSWQSSANSSRDTDSKRKQTCQKLKEFLTKIEKPISSQELLRSRFRLKSRKLSKPSNKVGPSSTNTRTGLSHSTTSATLNCREPSNNIQRKKKQSSALETISRRKLKSRMPSPLQLLKEWLFLNYQLKSQSRSL